MVSRDADRCLGGILIIVFFVSFGGAATLFSKGTILGIIGGLLLGALGIGCIIFFIIYSIRFYQAKARGQSPYTEGSLMPRSSSASRPVIMQSAIPVRIQPQPRVDSIDQRVKLLTELASLIVYERQIANWDPSHRTFGPISITPADLPVLFLMVIDEYYSNRATKMRNSFNAIAQPFKIFGADNIEGHIEQAIETIDNSYKMQFALELFKEIFPNIDTSIAEREPDKPMFVLDNDEKSTETK